MILNLEPNIAVISSEDSFAFQVMAQAVLENRPSFKTISAELNGQKASIFTRRIGGRDHALRSESLFIQSPSVNYILNKRDLERILTNSQN